MPVAVGGRDPVAGGVDDRRVQVARVRRPDELPVGDDRRRVDRAEGLDDVGRHLARPGPRPPARRPRGSSRPRGPRPGRRARARGAGATVAGARGHSGQPGVLGVGRRRGLRMGNVRAGHLDLAIGERPRRLKRRGRMRPTVVISPASTVGAPRPGTYVHRAKPAGRVLVRRASRGGQARPPGSALHSVDALSPTPARQRHPRGGGPGAQPARRHDRHPARRARRHHRAVGERQVEPRVRHALRRGAAALRREPVRLRAPVPRPDGQARRRPHRGPVAGHLDRPEDDEPQPALDGGDRHRDLRLPAPAVRPGRRAPLPDLRPADHGPERRADRRPRAGPAGGHPLPGAGAARARPQGRAPRRARADPGRGLLAGRGGRRRRTRSTRCPRSTRSSPTRSRSWSTGW